MAVSVYDKTFLNEREQQQLDALTQEWERAKAAGDKEAMQSAHSAAEEIRAGSGYSGGGDGGSYIKVGTENRYTSPQLPSYKAQVDAVNSAYDAARDYQLAALQSAYDQSRMELESQREKIPQIYDAQANAVAANSARDSRAFNEYAAAAGLNSGTGGQAQLAMSNQRQSDLTEVRTAQADAQAELENQIAQLKTQYQNNVASAIAQGEYQRAAALLDEYRAAEQSVVSVAQSQADLNYRDYTANQGMDADKAATLASYGDFSGYSALGYTQDQINAMRNMWVAANPDLAYAAGSISAGEYYRLTGGYPAGRTAIDTVESNTPKIDDNINDDTGGNPGNDNVVPSFTSLTGSVPWNISANSNYNAMSSNLRDLVYQQVESGVKQLYDNKANKSQIVSALRDAYDNGLINLADYTILSDKYAPGILRGVDSSTLS